MNPHQLPVVLALVAVAGASFLLFQVDRSMPRVEPPAVGSADAVKDVALDVPPIEEFAHYYGSEADAWQDLNPFVPAAARKRERDQLVRQRQRDKGQSDQTVATQRPPDLPPPPKPQAPIKRPAPKAFPSLGEASTVVPRVVGYLTGPGHRTLKVQFGPDGDVMTMQPGESHGAWTFVAVEDGNAVFTDEAGARHSFFISNPVAGTTTLSGTDYLEARQTGGGSGGAPGGMGGSMDGANLDPAAILKQIEGDPRGAAMLRSNPRIRQMIEKDPAKALSLFERLSRQE
ncbi:MAG: hypothetical protein PF961_03125 [Planctomycetota bacterium]|jgi:hypothetical protein|nr:hypothetical protein [Planctomycetota bacterium]